jgi:hypothetical protein
MTLHGKVSAMKENWAAENLQTIRTLMERSAIYRRALAPVMILTGSIGTLAAVLGWKLQIQNDVAFAGYWLVVAVIAVAASFVMIRRQALKHAEPFWSPPTRRIAQAMLPPLVAGLALTLIFGIAMARPDYVDPPTGEPSINPLTMVVLPALWLILYGCALHAAGFFMRHGIRLFGWMLVLGGCGIISLLLLCHQFSDELMLNTGYYIMGGFFGGLHLAYGVYLYFTEGERD